VGLAVLAYFLYSNLLAAARVWIEKDAPAGQLGLWWVHLVPLAIAGVMLWQELHPSSHVTPAAWWQARRHRRGQVT
jgi:lipopolysaccharide export system permease protein